MSDDHVTCSSALCVRPCSIPPKLDGSGSPICNVCARDAADWRCAACGERFSADYPLTALDVYSHDHGPYRGKALCLHCWGAG